MSGFSSSMVFIVQTLGNLFIYAVLLRFLLQLVKADFYNPLSQAVVKITSPLLKPLRRIIPGFGGMDIAALILAFVLEMILLYLLYGLRGASPSAVPIVLVMVQAVFKLIDLILNIYIFSMVIIAIASWVTSGRYNPALVLLMQLTDPIASRVRRIIPPIGGLDLSFMAIMLVIILIQGALPGIENSALRGLASFF
ncbi:hypothetical protein CI610_01896 [invertebrate metagenome]|uniref:YggT family protein n=1 Tax=invertebrate metagenome TaxID=1711999 RepID=A0A2H9T7E8_9ZZZZ